MCECGVKNHKSVGRWTFIHNSCISFVTLVVCRSSILFPRWIWCVYGKILIYYIREFALHCLTHLICKCQFRIKLIACSWRNCYWMKPKRSHCNTRSSHHKIPPKSKSLRIWTFYGNYSQFESNEKKSIRFYSSNTIFFSLQSGWKIRTDRSQRRSIEFQS